ATIPLSQVDATVRPAGWFARLQVSDGAHDARTSGVGGRQRAGVRARRGEALARRGGAAPIARRRGSSTLHTSSINESMSFAFGSPAASAIHSTASFIAPESRTAAARADGTVSRPAA